MTYWIIEHKRLAPYGSKYEELTHHLKGSTIEDVLACDEGVLLIRMGKD